MNVLFCYDGTMKMDKEGNLYPQALTEKVLNRYFSFGERIKIFCRKRIIEKNSSAYMLPKEIRKKVDIIECPNFWSIKNLLFKDRKFAKEVIDKEVKETDCCVIRLPSIVGRRALKTCNKNNKKYFVEMVGDPFDAYWNYNLAGKILAPIMFFKTKRNLRQAKNVQYVSKEFLQKRYPTKGYTISCSNVELKEIDANVLNKRIEKISNKNKNEKIVFGTLAAIDVKFKGQEYVIKAISKLKKLGYDKFEYQLVGGGDSSRLMQIAKKYKVLESVKFIGAKPHNEVFEWLDSIDIYIQPSNQEGLPRAVIEAMSRACPCIVSSTGGNPELINNDYVFKKRHVNQLVDRIKKMISSKDNELKEAKENFKNASDYEKSILDKRRRDFYQKVVNE